MTTLNMIEQMEAAEQRKQQEAGAKYRELISRNDKPRHGDDVALKRAIEVLGLTRADVERDLATLKRFAELSDWLSDERTNERRKKADKLMSDAGSAALATLQNIIAGLPLVELLRISEVVFCALALSDAEFAQLQQVRQRINAPISVASSLIAPETQLKLTMELAAIRRDNPRLFN